MVIDISGRTDIVNYYSEWMFRRFAEGYVFSRNSLFPNSVRRYELTPDRVDYHLGSKNYTPVMGRIHERLYRPRPGEIQQYGYYGHRISKVLGKVAGLQRIASRF